LAGTDRVAGDAAAGGLQTNAVVGTVSCFIVVEHQSDLR
jgi:hypothetical protein